MALRAGEGPNDVGSSRHHLIAATDAALERLGTDYIDLLQLHAFDAMTPVEQVARSLDDLVRAGKVRYVGASNFSGWQLMKALAASPCACARAGGAARRRARAGGGRRRALRCPPGLLLADRAGLRVGADAAGAR